LGARNLPRIYFLCEGLQAPPRAGFHVHLLSLARAIAQHVPVSAFCWGVGAGDSAWDAWSASLGQGPPPERFIKLVGPQRAQLHAVERKRRYCRSALAFVEQTAVPGSVVWIRDTSTGLFCVPDLNRRLRRRGVRFLYDVSTLVEHEWPLRSRGPLATARIVVERWLRRRFDLVRTLGEGMRGEIVRGGVDPARIIVVPVGASRPQRRWTPHGLPRRLLYVGSAQPWQGLPLLIETMRLLETMRPELRLTIAGRLGGAVQSDLPDNVMARGWVEREGIADLYLEHDLLVLPRPEHPLTQTVVPMKLAEALSFGIPLLVSDLPPIREVVGSEAAVYVADSHAAQWARAIAKLMDRPERLAELSAHAGRRFERFHWDAVASNAVKLLQAKGALVPSAGLSRATGR
jgi:glycosyltransferase involved in cell wall biosynthesis